MKVNKKLLPIKGHFFLFNAGTAPLVPYLSTYARQLGFTSATVGLIYTVLPIFGLIAKPLFGVIADRFRIQKLIFILFQIVTIVSFSAIYFIPGSSPSALVELDCGDGVTVLRSCMQDGVMDHCKATSLANLDSNMTASCDMDCDMSSANMWQTVCEHWHIPEYCYEYTNGESLRYSVVLANATEKDGCVHIVASNVALDGYEFIPRCRKSHAVLNDSCSLSCEQLPTFTEDVVAKMTCVDEVLNYQVCNVSGTDWKTIQNYQCQAVCDLGNSAPWRLMEICESWGADVTKSCAARTVSGKALPTNLSFVGTVALSTTLTEGSCMFTQLKHITMPDGSIHYPNCVSKPQYQKEIELFHPICKIICDNSVLNELLEAGSESSNGESQYTTEFWLFFAMMIISWIGQAVVVTFADAICFNVLGDRVDQYGKQRLWGSVGWGIFSLTTGALIDLMSDGAYKNYAIAFILMFVFMCGDVIVSCFVKNESTKISMNILADVGTLLSSLPTFVFILWTIGVGLCTGLLWQFLFWHLEDIAGLTCDGADYIKTLQGLVSAIQTFLGEIPFMFVSGYILKKVGHTNMMSLVLFAFGVRFILYSFLTNAWLVLPIEMFQGITFGMFYPTMTSYANIVAPPGAETTVQGLVGAIFEGVGVSLGSFIGGHMYRVLDGWSTFRWFGVGALVLGLIHAAAQWLLKDKIQQIAITQGYASVMKYEKPQDAVHMLDD
ncbi:major facilitator superfamily domain-containing protein 6 [Plodia interpunctella]|uniref:major facilitator superfamily domain-containing protein 6 n=1 Tax=Plodia interpunctella TaxID=58824 RepID=UPI0023684550|nr:major facilitator superfamily domain-containing protein 6 [Plodia interpunctella]XP_053623900.1 major facilitator superfamily domain-containing protein 6 [Plodia interpunctella]XP_053623901.1 major facilitator superfamily domain-containing protein 6 [Plodia interpunctella]XP_053623903.1 major facilitator superfamily domain-containing protein 6 [Plodia interpunctella]XP_053623904.1 major facilitator superfamily domain-containing protein 6 [Plodia interpunctella]